MKFSEAKKPSKPLLSSDQDLKQRMYSITRNANMCLKRREETIV